MNARNSIENQLRKWALRQASPELKSRIFGREGVESAARSFHLGEATRWLVPAFGCFLLVMSSLSTKLQESSTAQFAGANLMMASSTNERAAEMFYSKSQEHSEKNSIPCTKVEYGFATRPITSTVGSF